MNVISRSACKQKFRVYSGVSPTLILCHVNASQLMWAIAAEGGWSRADVKYKKTFNILLKILFSNYCAFTQIVVLTEVFKYS